MINLTSRASFLGTSPLKPHVVFCSLAVVRWQTMSFRDLVYTEHTTTPALRSLARKAVLAIPTQTAMPIAWAFGGMHRGLSRQKTEEAGEEGRLLLTSGPVPRTAGYCLNDITKKGAG